MVGDFFGCDEELLNDEKQIVTILKRAAKQANSTILSSTSFKFNPQGVTAVVVLKESHISCHSYPEHGFIAVDIYTCGKQTKPLAGFKYMKQAFAPKRTKFWFIKRGRH